MDIDHEIDRLRANYRTHLLEARDQLLRDARILLAQDIAAPHRLNPSTPRDQYMYRANALALAAADSGMLSTAAQVYVTLIEDIQERIAITGEQLPLGLLFVNLGSIYFTQGHYDRGVFYFLEAARDDTLVSGKPPDESYAVTHLMPKLVEESVLSKTLEAVQALDHSLTLSDVTSWYESLTSRRPVFLAYMRTLLDNRTLLGTHPHEYIYWQIFSSLRNLSALFEVEVKRYANEKSLSRALQCLYSSKSWWAEFTNERIRVGESMNSVIPCEVRLRQSFTITSSSSDVKFWKSLLITFITRNYTVHEMETANALDKAALERILISVLYTMITARKYSTI